MNIIYLDNAATTFPKPRRVCDEVSRCIRVYCGNPGRSSHPMASASAEKIYECRERLARFFDSDSPESVSFTLNATQAINTAIKGLLRRGDHVIISDMEHNAVYRPIEKLSREGFISYSIFRTVKDGAALSDEQILRSVKGLIRPYKTRMLICSHQSNLCSAARPISAIGALCREKGIIFAVDGAQSAGHVPINMKKDCIDVLCAPAHKGLFGIQGCGFMLLGDGVLPGPLTEGGNGVASLEWSMPELSPERFEAGTLPTPAVAALSEGIAFLSGIEPTAIEEKEKLLFIRARDMLLDSKELDATVYLPDCEGSVLLFNLKGIPSESVGRYLGDRGICVRSGYHCSALGHKALGTEESGAVRASFSLFNSEHDVDALIEALKYCAAEAKNK